MPPKKEKPLFARNLTYLRNQRRYTVAMASELTGIKRKTWCAWEEGRCYPGMNNITTICEALGFYDVYAMLNTDLAKTPATGTTRQQAIQSLMNLKNFLETIKTNQHEAH